MELNVPDQLDVLVVLGSLSDEPVAAQMRSVFARFGVQAHFAVCSAHRDHERLTQLVPAAENAGAKVFVAVAGKAAHLPGVIAALTTRPVIGVPVDSGLQGMDALLSVTQMPPGVPVAAVGVNAGKNAALLAVQVLAVGGPADLRDELAAYRRQLAKENREQDARLGESPSDG